MNSKTAILASPLLCLGVLTVIAAAFYNLFAELLGGVEVTVVEQEEISQ